ncbi:hypothetical protein [Alcanivorax sp. 1008]|uniref:hypothetical protein n=1 Tax=Alcanivorax sp. 1008 TaxID=2816853 RepID=UPI001DCFB6BB|nr:hypothetical protein [Alcanivorax sp. 1008]MCC1496772.1 hypothetical protein [Alcanivorax sp. 1008]
MTTSPAVELWMECLGTPLGYDDPDTALGPILPQRGAGGVIKEYRLGSGRPVYLMLSPGNSVLVSAIALPDQPGLTFVPDESVDGPRYMAEWLLTARPPYIVAIAGKASLGPFLTMTEDERFGMLCQSAGNQSFDMTVVRRAKQALEPFDWRTAASTLHLMTRYQASPSEADREKLRKAFAKTPGLSVALMQSGLKPNSGEYTLMSWLNRQPRQEAA